MVVFPCHVCRTQLSADDAQAGQLVRCPTCLTTLRVPAPQSQPATSTVPVGAFAGVGASSGSSSASTASSGGVGTMAPPRPYAPTSGAPRPSVGKRYGFNCGYCSSRLEANESMAAQEGQCPTCGNNITIPILDRYGRLIDPKTRQIIKQDPHPVHAYAAAGERAPVILRSKDGKQQIRCPRCQGASPITANNCKGCGMPFTMEGTTLEAAGTSNGFCVASLVLGIIGLPASCVVLPSVLAIIFGVIGLNQVASGGEGGGGKGMAIAGIICGALGCLIGLLVIANNM
jgi:DNA-directed RNA polymerase subunit RPC12/RpoP